VSESASTAIGPSRNVRWVILAVAAVVTAVLVFAIPPEQTLGELVRLVIFHGATTWVNLATFTLAALLSAAFLVSGRLGLYWWASAFRYVSLPLWIYNTVLGIVSMRLAWNGFNWAEPRLQMTFWVLMGALVVFSADFLVGNRRLTAALDIGLAGVLWYLLTTSHNLAHPDSPVFASGPTIVAIFLGQVAACFVIAVVVASFVRDRLARAHVGQEADRELEGTVEGA
jgi:hypothetical protein